MYSIKLLQFTYYILLLSFFKLLIIKLVPINYKTKDFFALGFLIVLDFIFLWLFQLFLFFNFLRILILIFESLQHLLILTEF